MSVATLPWEYFRGEAFSISSDIFKKSREVFRYLARPEIRESIPRIIYSGEGSKIIDQAVSVNINILKSVIFESYAKIWLRDTEFVSSTEDICQHFVFQELKKLGQLSAEQCLRRLEQGDFRAHWFLLLHAISGQNPIAPFHRGIVRKMAEDWISWGVGRGLLKSDAGATVP